MIQTGDQMTQLLTRFLKLNKNMTKDINELLKEYRSGDYRLDLLTKEKALLFILELKKQDIRVYGFDGFNVGKNIKPIHGFTINDNSVQIEQTHSRDYSSYEKNVQYQMCIDYFTQESNEDILYDISF